MPGWSEQNKTLATFRSVGSPRVGPQEPLPRSCENDGGDPNPPGPPPARPQGPVREGLGRGAGQRRLRGRQRARGPQEQGGGPHPPGRCDPARGRPAGGGGPDLHAARTGAPLRRPRGRRHRVPQAPRTPPAGPPGGRTRAPGSGPRSVPGPPAPDSHRGGWKVGGRDAYPLASWLRDA